MKITKNNPVVVYDTKAQSTSATVRKSVKHKKGDSLI